MNKRDVVPTVVIYVTRNPQTSLSFSSPSTSTSTIFLTEVVGSPGTNTFIPNAINTVFPLVLNVSPLVLTNQMTTLTTLSALSTSLGSASKVTGASNQTSSGTSTKLLSSASNQSTSSATAPILSADASAGTKLGLAIAIPITAVCLVGMIVFGVFLLRKRLGSQRNAITTVGKRGLYAVGLEALSSSKRPKSGLRNVYPQSVGSPGYDVEAGAKKVKPNFLNRLSRIIVPDSPLEFKSPMFLRRFHLNAPDKCSKPETDSGHPNKQLPKAPLLAHTYEAATSIGFSIDPLKDQSSQPESLYTVIKPYVKRLNDEITVCIGEKVKIVKFHSDGWATVKIDASDDSGVIPLMCLRKGS